MDSSKNQDDNSKWNKQSVSSVWADAQKKQVFILNWPPGGRADARDAPFQCAPTTNLYIWECCITKNKFTVIIYYVLLESFCFPLKCPMHANCSCNWQKIVSMVFLCFLSFDPFRLGFRVRPKKYIISDYLLIGFFVFIFFLKNKFPFVVFHCIRLIIAFRFECLKLLLKTVNISPTV